MQNPNLAQYSEGATHEGKPVTLPPLSRTRTRLWLWRLFFGIAWFVAYWILPNPMDTWFLIMTGLAFGMWLYNLTSGRMKLPPLTMKFERAETITLTHILLALVLLVLFANHSELERLNTKMIDVQDSVTDVQNSAADNTDEIKSSLDDVKSAIEANQ